MSVCTAPAARRADGAPRDRPGPPLLALARGEERDQVEEGEGLADHGLQPGLAHVEALAHLRRARLVHVRQLRLQAGRDRGGPGTALLRVGHQLRRRLERLALGHIGHVEHRLGGERLEPDLGARGVLGRRHGAHGAPGLQRLHHLSQPALLGHQLLVQRARLAGHALQAALGLLQVGEQQLRVHRVHVGERVHPSLRVHDLRVVVGPDHVHDRVRLADVAQEAVAQPLAAWRPRAPGPRCRGTRSSRTPWAWPGSFPPPDPGARPATGTTATFGSTVVKG